MPPKAQFWRFGTVQLSRMVTDKMSCKEREDVLPIVRLSRNVYRAPHIRMKPLDPTGNSMAIRDESEPMEMRKEIRYRLDAPAVFSWEGAHHRRLQGEGITRDISVQGAFILTATMPPPDCPVQVDLLLPSLTGVKGMMRITGRARVIRLDQPSSDHWIHGFAVVTDDLHQWGLMTMQGDSEIELVATARAH
jgi:hypothetical protein